MAPGLSRPAPNRERERADRPTLQQRVERDLPDGSSISTPRAHAIAPIVSPSTLNRQPALVRKKSGNASTSRLPRFSSSAPASTALVERECRAFFWQNWIVFNPAPVPF